MSLTVRWLHSYMYVKLITIWQPLILQLEMLDESFAGKVSFKEGP
jgi:hypothetical protein